MQSLQRHAGISTTRRDKKLMKIASNTFDSLKYLRADKFRNSSINVPPLCIIKANERWLGD